MILRRVLWPCMLVVSARRSQSEKEERQHESFVSMFRATSNKEIPDPLERILATDLIPITRDDVDMWSAIFRRRKLAKENESSLEHVNEKERRRKELRQRMMSDDEWQSILSERYRRRCEARNRVTGGSPDAAVQLVATFANDDPIRYFTILDLGGNSRDDVWLLGKRGLWPDADSSERLILFSNCTASLRRRQELDTSCASAPLNFGHVVLSDDNSTIHNIGFTLTHGHLLGLGGRYEIVANLKEHGIRKRVLVPGREGATLLSTPLSRLQSSVQDDWHQSLEIKYRALLGNQNGCIEMRRNYNHKCEFDGRFSLVHFAKSDRILVYARANMNQQGGGRFLQVVSTSLQAALHPTNCSTRPAWSRFSTIEFAPAMSSSYSRNEFPATYEAEVLLKKDAAAWPSSYENSIHDQQAQMSLLFRNYSLDVATHNGNVYYGAINPNPTDDGTSLLGLFPMRIEEIPDEFRIPSIEERSHKRKGTIWSEAYHGSGGWVEFPPSKNGSAIALALTCDGIHFSTPKPILRAVPASIGRTNDHPVDGFVTRGKNVFIYIHVGVPGTFGKLPRAFEMSPKSAILRYRLDFRALKRFSYQAKSQLKRLGHCGDSATAAYSSSIRKNDGNDRLSPALLRHDGAICRPHKYTRNQM